MNKIFTVISLLLFVAFANSTKQVTYSEIVSSLAQVSHVEGADAIMDGVKANWSENLKNLNAYNSALATQCDNIVSRANERAKTFTANMAGFKNTVEELQGNLKSLQQSVQDGRNTLKESATRIQGLRSSIEDNAREVEEHVMGIVERDRVLRRLENILEDELTGSQRHATVGNYNVNNTVSGITFLEVHNQLKELDSKDPVVKSMISTLILITQDTKNLFSNQANVGKIRNMIAGIIRRGEQSVQRQRQESEMQINQIRQQIQEQSELAQRAVDNVNQKEGRIQQSRAVIRFTETARRGMEAHAKRAATRRENNIAMCNKVRKLNVAQQENIQAGLNRFASLRQLLDEGH